MEQNSSEMKTVVETFIIEETAELIYDNEKLTQWNSLVAELGLTGQTAIVSPDKSPIPFMHMKKSLGNVFSELCPRNVCVEEYSATPIPVEILSLIALAKREGYFQKIEIWYDDKDPDPVCIGIKGYWYQPTWYDDRVKELDGKQFNTKQEAEDAGAKTAYFREEAKYLIGRWADVKRSFTELKEMAHKRFMDRKGVELRKTIKEAERELSDLETTAFEKFN